jgi:hypothetical protein
MGTPVQKTINKNTKIFHRFARHKLFAVNPEFQLYIDFFSRISENYELRFASIERDFVGTQPGAQTE